uniref:Uncharacterized protein n=1 Tax=Mycena chlorophos TaxID=658473 RepID=A0ABQ0L010_MYCCL|nr:predicted protein [Mycena chlorophos]
MPGTSPALSLLLLLFVAATHSSTVVAQTLSTGTTNITIDDTDSRYFTWDNLTDADGAAQPGWNAASTSHRCSCSAQPDLNATEAVQAADIYNLTWHDGDLGSAGSFTFNGSAVYIYGIDMGQPTAANISFTLDNNPSLTRFHVSQVTDVQEFVFHSLFFSWTNLDTALNHTVSWTLLKSATNGTSALFDYAVVTVLGTAEANPVASSGTSDQLPAPSAPPSLLPSHHSSINLGGVLGGTLSGIAVLIFLILGVLMFRRRRRERRIPPSKMVFSAGTGRHRHPHRRQRAGGRKRDSDMVGLRSPVPAAGYPFPDSDMDVEEGMPVTPSSTAGAGTEDALIGTYPPSPSSSRSQSRPVLTPNRPAAAAASAHARNGRRVPLPKGYLDSFEDVYAPSPAARGSSQSHGSGSTVASSQVVSEMIERQALAMQNLQASWKHAYDD